MIQYILFGSKHLSRKTDPPDKKQTHSKLCQNSVAIISHSPLISSSVGCHLSHWSFDFKCFFIFIFSLYCYVCMLDMINPPSLHFKNFELHVSLLLFVLQAFEVKILLPHNFQGSHQFAHQNSAFGWVELNIILYVFNSKHFEFSGAKDLIFRDEGSKWIPNTNQHCDAIRCEPHRILLCCPYYIILLQGLST